MLDDLFTELHTVRVWFIWQVQPGSNPLPLFQILLLAMTRSRMANTSTILPNAVIIPLNRAQSQILQSF